MAFTISCEYSKYNKKFKLTQKCVEFKLNQPDKVLVDPTAWLKDGLRVIYDHILRAVNPGDKLGLTFSSEDFSSDFHVAFKLASQHRFEEVWHLLHLLYQSKKQAIEGDTFKITATSFTPLRGAGTPRLRTGASLTFEEDCKKRRGVVCIKNKDNLCLPRALVVAIAYLLNVPYLKQVRQNIGKRQDQETQKLMAEVGVKIPPGGAGFEELQQFQRHLSAYKITVYNYGSKGREVMFEGPDAPLKINLLHHGNHYNVITNLTGAFCCIYFCQSCHKPFNNKDRHRCSAQCPGCRQQPPCEKIRDEILCTDCNRLFRGQECFDKHRTSGKNSKSICDTVRRCGECLKTIKAERQHYCGEVFCRICKKHQPSGHLCFIQPDTGKPKLDETIFVFFDLEARQDTVNLRGESMHVPVLCVFQQRCHECFNVGSDELESCGKCGVRRQVIQADDVIQPFFQHLWTLAKKFKHVVVLAHNGQAYDHQFVLRHIMDNTDLKPELIMRGSKLLMLTVGKIKFIDSVNYFPMSLSALPKAFGLKELKKGYFPHLYNTVANKDYIGPLPDAKYYGADTMKPGDRASFLEWHAEHKNDIFDMKMELVEYCISDVEILTQASIKFHIMVMEQGNVSPFTEAITIPGACNKLFRRNFLRSNTIGVIPKNGYRMVDTQSRIALQWLIYEEQQRALVIQHAGRQREAIIDGVKVDGYCDKTVFEFHGCYFHGCLTCFPVNRDAEIHEDPTDTLEARYERTLRKVERLRQRGYEVVEMWECQFRRILEKDRTLKEQLENHSMLQYLPLDPRDAFFGGRTGCCKSYYSAKPGEKIKYVDVCSLYPWVCKYGKFPIGHPKVHVGSDCPTNINGLIKCKILPPTQLYHPVLPMKANDKLMFVLCQSCGLDLNQAECQHTDDERALVGTWVMDEVQKALEKGYTLLEIYEVWQYDVTQYKDGNGGLFAEMMDKFIRLKQQASGWPSDCVTDEQKTAYIERFLQTEGVQMVSGEILKNPGLRSLAKLILNSFWGKFGQRENQQKTEIIRQPADLSALSCNSAININHLTVINEDVLVASWEYKEEAVDSLATVNVVIAAYVTAQARLKLYSYLEKLGDRVLYYDTDSVIYVVREGEWDVPTGSSLGEMTNELEEYGRGSYITEFSSAGPKNYSYTVFSPNTGEHHQTCKVKGFCLNHQVAQRINADVMKKMVLGETEPMLIETRAIKTTAAHQLVTRDESKIYRACLEKRKFGEDYDSLPYGFKRSKPN